jgi:hypothetical protein
MANTGVKLDEKRLVMLDDVCECEGRLVDDLGVEKGLVSKNKPTKCSKCGCKDIQGVEVMGTYEGTLFWECEECDSAILRFEENKTEEYLQLAKGLWTNPSDWGYVPRSEFN